MRHKKLFNKWCNMLQFKSEPGSGAANSFVCRWRLPWSAFQNGLIYPGHNIKLCIVLLFELGLTGLQAQESVPASGGNASGSGGSVSYSVGQVVYLVYAGINGSLAEGVQQPYEISVVTEIEKTKGINLSVSAFPNPASDYLTLTINELEFSNLCYQLFDMSGKLLESKNIIGNQTSIVIKNLVHATYFVKVIQNSKEIKIFKIIKH